MSTEHLPAYGMFAVDRDARTVRGILLPWGQRSRTSVSKTKPITFPRGSVTIPRDPSVVGLNRMHDRFDWIGRATHLVDEPVGIVATFAIADTDEGDAWLADHGDLTKLSPEVKGITRDDADFGTAILTAAAVVDEGAFATAALFAVDHTETPAPDPAQGRGIVPPDLEAAAREAARSFGGDVPHDPGPRPRPDDDDLEPEVDDTDEATADSDDEPTEESDEEEGDTMGDAIAPPTMLGGRTRVAARTEPRLSKEGFFAALHEVRRTGSKDALAPYVKSAQETGMFAVNNITYDDASGIAASSGLPDTWLGELAAGARFARTIVPLLTQATLTSLVATGWVWLTRPSMQRWAGNKTPVPSSTATTGPKSFTAQRFGNVNDLAREFYDFNVTEVINSFVEAVVDSYYVESDDFALEKLLEGATPATTTSGTVSGMLAQLARQVLAARVAPTFAVVAPDVFDAFTDVTNSEQSAYFSPTINLADGSLAGIPLVPDDRLAAGQAIVGAKSAATAWELPGVPIRVTAPDLVLGGYDEAMFGYIAVGVTYPAGVVKSTLTLPATARSGDDEGSAKSKK
jgi:hypothetical protein